MEITLKSIGFAKNNEGKHFGGWGSVVTDLVVERLYQEGLLGLEGYSHAVVLYWMHEVSHVRFAARPTGEGGRCAGSRDFCLPLYSTAKSHRSFNGKN